MVVKKQKSTTLLAKYGKLEHLELLAAGHVYFNPINKYRTDSSAYRGDINEGFIPIDPTTLKIFDPDGNNILEKIPLPTSVRQSFVGDDSLLIRGECGLDVTCKVWIKAGKALYKGVCETSHRAPPVSGLSAPPYQAFCLRISVCCGLPFVREQAIVKCSPVRVRLIRTQPPGKTTAGSCFGRIIGTGTVRDFSHFVPTW